MGPRRLVRPLLVLALLLAACQGPPPRAARAPEDPGAQAAEALELGQYLRAADLYRLALEGAPGSLPLHYGLALAASHLDRREEAVREFRWVLEHGEAGSEPVEVARRWLASVGALPPSARAPEQAGEPPGHTDAGEDPERKRASLEGRAVVDRAAGPAQPMRRLRLFLIGHPDRLQYYTLRTDEEGRFRFGDVVPGVYKLTDRVVGPATWRLRVELKPGEVATLNLAPGNSVRVRDDFPG
jgi:hypothetical protein